MPFKLNPFTNRMDYYEAGSSGGGDVTGPASSTAGNIAVFDDATGKVIADSGVDIADVATLPITGFIPTIGSSTNNAFAAWDGAGGTAIKNQTSVTSVASGGILVSKPLWNLSDNSIQVGQANTGISGSAGSLSIVANGNAQIVVSGTSLTLGASSFVTLGRALRIIRETTAVSMNAQLLSSMYIGVTDTSAPRTITLPNNGNSGQIYIIKDESGGAGSNNITVTSTGSATIDGAASVTINTNYGVVRVISGGTNLYYVI